MSDSVTFVCRSPDAVPHALRYATRFTGPTFAREVEGFDGWIVTAPDGTIRQATADEAARFQADAEAETARHVATYGEWHLNRIGHSTVADLPPFVRRLRDARKARP